MYDLIATRMMAGGPLYELNEDRAQHAATTTPSTDRSARRPSLAFGRWLRTARPRATEPCMTSACTAC